MARLLLAKTTSSFLSIESKRGTMKSYSVPWLSLAFICSVHNSAIAAPDAKTTDLNASNVLKARRVIRYSGNTLVYELMRDFGREYAKFDDVDVQAIGLPDQVSLKQLVQGQADIAIVLNTNQGAVSTSDWRNYDVVAIGADAVVLTYNVQGGKLPIRFTGPMLADIYSGKIGRWNDLRLRRYNHATNLPNESIVVARPDGPAFLTYAGSNYLQRVSRSWKNRTGSGYEVNWPMGSDPRGVIGEEIIKTPNSIEFNCMVTAVAMHVPFGLLQNPTGRFVAPTATSIASALTHSSSAMPPSGPSLILNSPGRDSYPIVYRLFLVTRKESRGGSVLAGKFARWISRYGAPIIKRDGFVPLPLKRSN